jgi:membrane-associated phospholipid phosphatase
MAGLPAAAGLCLLTVLVLAANGVPFSIDTLVHKEAVGHRPVGVRDVATVITDTGTGVVPYLAALAAGWLAGRTVTPVRLRARLAVAAAGTLLAGQAVRFAFVEAVHRARPPAGDWAVHVSGAAFPSGHTTTSAITAGLLAWAVLRSTRAAGTRAIAVALLCVAWAMAVGVTRVVLGVHWPTDVLGGWLLATCWLAVWLPLLDRLGGFGAAAVRPARPRPAPRG